MRALPIDSGMLVESDVEKDHDYEQSGCLKVHLQHMRWS